MSTPPEPRDRGFSLIEATIAIAITAIVMASVFLLLQRGQRSFQREPEVTEMHANARTSLDQIGKDLTVAGYNTPINMPVMWFDGGGVTPDEITILYADPQLPVSRPKSCRVEGGGPCTTLGGSSALDLDPFSFSPEPLDYEQTYREGMLLFAIQGPNGDPACNEVAPGIISLSVTGPPRCTGTGGVGVGPASCGTLIVGHNPGQGVSPLSLPGGFESDVHVQCAVVGRFHIVHYRVNPLPPAENPTLERRDVALGDPWMPIAVNIENLQIQYAQGMAEAFEDTPSIAPLGSDPNSWITRVRVTVSGRNESRNLEGASAGVYAAEDTFLRQKFTTTISLRNQLSQAQQIAEGLGLSSWN